MARHKLQTDGIRELQAALRRADADNPKLLRLAFNAAGEVVIGYARPRMPSRSGRARGSLKSASSQREGRISMGGRKAPHAPWLDFGGKVGRNRSVSRPFIREGRYIYRGLAEKHEEITQVLADQLADVVRRAGLEVE